MTSTSKYRFLDNICFVANTQDFFLNGDINCQPKLSILPNCGTDVRYQRGYLRRQITNCVFQCLLIIKQLRPFSEHFDNILPSLLLNQQTNVCPYKNKNTYWCRTRNNAGLRMPYKCACFLSGDKKIAYHLNFQCLEGLLDYKSNKIFSIRLVGEFTQKTCQSIVFVGLIMYLYIPVRKSPILRWTDGRAKPVIGLILAAVNLWYS